MNPSQSEIDAPALHGRFACLTARKTDIVSFRAKGCTNKQIASILGLSTRTVETYWDNAKKKIGISEFVPLVRAAIEAGLGAPPSLEECSDGFAALSPREKEVMQLTVAGASNQVTAPTLGLTTQTVIVYRARLMGKMGCNNLAELVGAAWTLEQAGLLPKVQLPTPSTPALARLLTRAPSELATSRS